jgi:chondroitin-sulfate-ABC endolyase/exolyase
MQLRRKANNMDVVCDSKAPVFSFESGVPGEMTAYGGSAISTSRNRFKDGQWSLRWDYCAGSSIRLSHPVGYRPNPEGGNDQHKTAFAVWIYNETPVQDRLKFEFGRGEQIDCSFEFGLNFCGWRTAWVLYDRDMEGSPHPGMDRLTIHVPKHMRSGTLYIDQLILSARIDPRFPMRDAQVPRVNMEADHKANSHWMSLYRFAGQRPVSSPIGSVTAEQRAALELVRERYGQLSPPRRNMTEGDMTDIRQRFQECGIERRGESIVGRSVDLVYYYDILPPEDRERLRSLSRSIEVKTYTRFMLKIAECYNSATAASDKEQLAALFIDLLDHLRDQGWAAGSGLGTLHHLGYNLRSYYTALYLMKEPLAKSGKLKACLDDMYWFSGTGRIFAEASDLSGGIIDIFNTTIHGMLAVILMMEDEGDLVRHLHGLSDWVSRCLMPAPGLMSCLKADGSAFHHAGHYPAYAVGGFEGVTPVVYILSGTPFRIGEQAHACLRKALLSMRLYCNKRQWLLSLSARHPTGTRELETLPFKYMAAAGSPDGTEPIDKEMAAAYLRLASPEEAEAGRMFADIGIRPEPAPEGHWTMNYAALSLHRRGEWLAGARGHSKYLWANETYSNANLYGRYITHGHVQIMASGDPVTNMDSGFSHDGWDWNRWPGTTVIRLPIEQLRSDVRQVDTHSGFEEMLLSDEAYAGGLSIGGENGMFAMKLHEHEKYNGSHRASKSVFFFDDRIVLLGSGIMNDNADYATETTLFQLALLDSAEPIRYGDTEPLTEFPYERKHVLSEPQWIVDNKQNGYYVPSGQKLFVSRCTQHSRSQNRGEETKGDFVSAWLHHGFAPENERYEYAIRVKTTADQMRRFTERMQCPETALYRVLQHDDRAHIVHDVPTGTIGYALFEAGDPDCLPRGVPVVSTNIACMAMTKETEDGLTLSVVDPDLRLYTGVDADQYDDTGKRKEVSIYSRPWIANESMPSLLELTLKGRWRLPGDEPRCRIMSRDDTFTTLQFTCKDATPIEVWLEADKP